MGETQVKFNVSRRKIPGNKIRQLSNLVCPETQIHFSGLSVIFFFPSENLPLCIPCNKILALITFPRAKNIITQLYSDLEGSKTELQNENTFWQNDRVANRRVQILDLELPTGT